MSYYKEICYDARSQERKADTVVEFCPKHVAIKHSCMQLTILNFFFLLRLCEHSGINSVKLFSVTPSSILFSKLSATGNHVFTCSPPFTLTGGGPTGLMITHLNGWSIRRDIRQFVPLKLCSHISVHIYLFILESLSQVTFPVSTKVIRKLSHAACLQLKQNYSVLSISL
jgi:hypothetical protein